jgi:hypothetical protein
MTNGPEGPYTYDAAGRNTNIEMGYSAEATAFDGDGQQVKTVESTLEESGWVPETKYYVRSTVLGGQVLSEINADGSSRTYVYAGTAVFGWHYGASASLTIDHRDPSGASMRSGGAQQELDPFGADSGISAQTVVPDEGTLAGFGSSYQPALPNFGYTIDGLRVTLDAFISRLGHVAKDPFDLLEVISASSTRPAGYRNSGVSWGRRFDAIYDANGQIESVNWGEWDPELRDVNYGEMQAIYGSTAWSQLSSLITTPQNPAPFDIPGIRQGLKDALKKWDCRELIQDLLDAAKTKKNPLAKSGDIMSLFESIVNGSGGFTRTAPPGSAGYGNPLGRIAKGDAGIFSRGDARHSASLQLIFDTQTVLHELLHLAGSKRYYTDQQFAEAVQSNPANQSRSPYPPDTPALQSELKDPGAIGWGAYWDDVLKQKCFEGR